MRPYTADESLLSVQGTMRWRRKSLGQRVNDDVGSRMVRNLLITNNVHGFIDNSTVRLESDSLCSVKQLAQKEVIHQLSEIKQRFNVTQKRFSIDDSNLKVLQRVSNEKNLEAQVAAKNSARIQSIINDLQFSLSQVLSKQEECWHNTQIYTHIYERSKKSQIFFEKKKNALKGKLKEAKIVVEIEKRAGSKTRDSKAASQRVYSALERVVREDTALKKARVHEWEKDLVARDFLKSQREDRKRRFIEIAECAANEDQDKKMTYLREGVTIYKLWARFLSSKLENEVQSSRNIETAFQKIRTITGEYNINELIHKFLTREQTFKDLKFSVDLSRDSIAEATKKNLDLEKAIKEIVICDKESRMNDLFNLKEKYAEKLRALEVERYRLSDVKLTHVHVMEWVGRIAEQFGVDMEKNKTLVKKFSALAEIITRKLKAR